MRFKEHLIELGACDEAVEWVGRRGIRRAWTECEHGGWMMWLLAKTGFDQKAFVLIASSCAERALVRVPTGEDRPAKAIATARAWTRGEATADEAKRAAEAVPSRTHEGCAALTAALAAAFTFYAAIHSSRAVDYAVISAAAPPDERKAQADIIRHYISVDAIDRVWRGYLRRPK